MFVEICNQKHNRNSPVTRVLTFKFECLFKKYPTFIENSDSGVSMHRKSFIEKLLKTTTFGPILKTENLSAIHIEHSYAVAKLQKY